MKTKEPAGATSTHSPQLDRKLAAQDIEELILFSVSVQRWAEFRCGRVPPDTPDPSRLPAFCQDLGDVRLLSDWPREAGAAAGEHDEPLGVVRYDR